MSKGIIGRLPSLDSRVSPGEIASCREKAFNLLPELPAEFASFPLWGPIPDWDNDKARIGDAAGGFYLGDVHMPRARQFMIIPG